MNDSPREMVLVVWADAHAEDTSGWAFLSEMSDRGEYLVETIGWLLSPKHGGKDGHVTVAQSLTRQDDACDHVVHVPLGMVRELYRLERGSGNMAKGFGKLKNKKRTRPD